MPLPLFSYPLTTMWVDDDSLFLATVNQLLNNNLLITFTSPSDCIKFFQQYVPLLQQLDFTQGFTQSENYEMLNHLPIDLNMSVLRSLYSNRNRENEIAVLITDYNMPGMNGIDLCREIRHLPMKKILLTGEADYQQAVVAFNEGIIDCFIQKDSPTLVKDILFHLERLSKQYLYEQSKQLLNHLETDISLHLSDPIFCDFFNNWCRENNIKEYYVVDKNGNLLLLNQKNEKLYFVVHTDRTLKNFVDLHQEDENVSILVDEIKAKNKIPFFGIGVESWELQPDQLIKGLHSVQILKGRDIYYWASVKNI